MYEIQILWAGQWITVQGGFKSRDDAEWATASWKQKNHCTGDPFRAVLVAEKTVQERLADFAETIRR